MASGCKTWTGKLRLHSLTDSHGNVNAKQKSGATRSLVKRSLYSTNGSADKAAEVFCVESQDFAQTWHTSVTRVGMGTPRRFAKLHRCRLNCSGGTVVCAGSCTFSERRSPCDVTRDNASKRKNSTGCDLEANRSQFLGSSTSPKQHF